MNSEGTKGSERIMNERSVDDRIDHLQKILKVIHDETSPRRGHADPGAIKDCWDEVFENLSQLAGGVDNVSPCGRCYACINGLSDLCNGAPRCRICGVDLDEVTKTLCPTHIERYHAVHKKDCICTHDGRCQSACEYCLYRACPVGQNRGADGE